MNILTVVLFGRVNLCLNYEKRVFDMFLG